MNDPCTVGPGQAISATGVSCLAFSPSQSPLPWPSNHFQVRDGHDEMSSRLAVSHLLAQDLVTEIPGQDHNKVGSVFCKPLGSSMRR